jgi:hypothetical protein
VGKNVAAKDLANARGYFGQVISMPFLPLRCVPGVKNVKEKA